MINYEIKHKLKKDIIKDPTYKKFLERVEKIRKNKNQSQYVFAESLGITQSTYNSFIHGRITSSYVIWQIIKLMKGDLRWLEENTEV